jgi:hypothetical protein
MYVCQMYILRIQHAKGSTRRIQLRAVKREAAAHPTVVPKAAAMVGRSTLMKGVVYWMTARLRMAVYRLSCHQKTHLVRSNSSFHRNSFSYVPLARQQSAEHHQLQSHHVRSEVRVQRQRGAQRLQTGQARRVPAAVERLHHLPHLQGITVQKIKCMLLTPARRPARRRPS